jgi:hypothetical protein
VEQPQWGALLVRREPMGVVKRIRHRPGDRQRDLCGQGTDVTAQAMEVGPLHELHHHGPAIRQPDQAIDLDDGRMVQQAQQPGLVQAALDDLVIVHQMRMDGLEGHQLLKPRPRLHSRAVDLAEGPLTDQSGGGVAATRTWCIGRRHDQFHADANEFFSSRTRRGHSHEGDR